MEGRAGEGAHVAGKIRVPGSAQAPSVPLNISPSVVRSTTEGGKQEANGGKLAFIRAVQAFTCHGAAVPPPISIQLTFTSHTGSLFLSLYAPRYCLAASAGFGRQFAKLRALSRLRRRYDSRKKRILLSPVSFPTPPPCGRDWLPWYECSAGTPPDRPPACRPQSAA